MRKQNRVGQTVLVVGASGGMGQATCAALKAAGYAVVGIDKHLPAKPIQDVLYFACDIRDEASVLEAVEHLRMEDIHLYAIIHMAGMYILDSLVEIEESQFIKLMNVNLFGVYRVNRLFLPFLDVRGRIVITSSELAPLNPLPFTGLYALSKTALEAYAKSLRMELQLLGHSVSVIRPGAVYTGMLASSTKSLDIFCEKTKLYQADAATFHAVIDRVESKRISPQKIAQLALRCVSAKRPKYVYNINRNIWLRLLSALPMRWQLAIIYRLLHR